LVDAVFAVGIYVDANFALAMVSKLAATIDDQT
jgi:hypothetical protein